MGLIFAAMAGYDPRVAVGFWQRMAAQNGGGNSSDMFSDHPSDAKRIAAIQRDMPEAMKYYQGGNAYSDSLHGTKAKQKMAKSGGSVSVSDLYKSSSRKR